MDLSINFRNQNPSKMASFSVFALLFLAFHFIHLFECTITPVQFSKGFSIDLVHRDSHKSPYHDPSSSRFRKLNQAFGRSLIRVTFLKHKSSKSSSSSIESQVAFQGGEYIMNVSLGTPPVVMAGIVDTGSDVTWTQCSPCNQCYKQNLPFFNPRNTSTYKRLSCQSKRCKSIVNSIGCDHHGKCQYDFRYGDGSYSSGDLATETFTFESSSGGAAFTIPDIAFGCTHGTRGKYNESASGIVGLGGGEISIVNQLSKYTDKMFSYCLVPYGSDNTSKIHFGTRAIVSGPNVSTTPLFKKHPSTFYYINLEGISVGNTRLQNSQPNHLAKRILKDTKRGNMILDSGTTVTILPTKLYYDLESTLNSTISGNRTSDEAKIFSLCYKVEGDLLPVFPDLLFHFTDADVLFPSENYFVEVVDGQFCLAMLPNDDVSILGNLSTMNFHVGIDLENKKVNFQPTDCSREH